MSKISCNVIQDIMPLYVDEIVSEDTKKRCFIRYFHLDFVMD